MHLLNISSFEGGDRSFLDRVYNLKKTQPEHTPGQKTDQQDETRMPIACAKLPLCNFPPTCGCGEDGLQKTPGILSNILINLGVSDCY